MHIYSACAVGVGAVLTAPVTDAESWAASCLPIIGGHSACEANNKAWPAGDPVVSFSMARTELRGTQTGPNEYTTTVRKTVMGLNILNRVTGNLDATLTFKYFAKPGRVDDEVEVSITPAAPYAGLTLHGVSFSPASITFKKELYEGAGKNFKKFRGDINTLRPGAKHLKHAHGEPGGHNHGLIMTALAEPEASLLYNNPDHGKVDVPGLGSVYFGEWWAEPYRQSFTLLRVKMKDAQDRLNPATKFSGQIVIDEEENGRDVP